MREILGWQDFISEVPGQIYQDLGTILGWQHFTNNNID